MDNHCSQQASSTAASDAACWTKKTTGPQNAWEDGVVAEAMAGTKATQQAAKTVLFWHLR